jgi:3-methylcrotonyl-CoA carboxylase alpha subunit
MRQWNIRLPDAEAAEAEAGTQDGELRAPMHGKVTQLCVGQGQRVRRGDRVAVLEAMKMEHVLQAPFNGVVERFAVESGAQVEEGALIAVVAEKARS